VTGIRESTKRERNKHTSGVGSSVGFFDGDKLGLGVGASVGPFVGCLIMRRC